MRESFHVNSGFVPVHPSLQPMPPPCRNTAGQPREGPASSSHRDQLTVNKAHDLPMKATWCYGLMSVPPTLRC